MSKIISSPSGCTFGVVSEDKPAQTKLYAFAIADRSGPKVFEYPDDDDGREELANLIRAETVIAIIAGRKVEFEMSSTVSIGDVENRMLVNRG